MSVCATSKDLVHFYTRPSHPSTSMRNRRTNNIISAPHERLGLSSTYCAFHNTSHNHKMGWRGACSMCDRGIRPIPQGGFVDQTQQQERDWFNSRNHDKKPTRCARRFPGGICGVAKDQAFLLEGNMGEKSIDGRIRRGGSLRGNSSFIGAPSLRDS